MRFPILQVQDCLDQFGYSQIPNAVLIAEHGRKRELLFTVDGRDVRGGCNPRREVLEECGRTDVPLCTLLSN